MPVNSLTRLRQFGFSNRNWLNVLRSNPVRLLQSGEELPSDLGNWREQLNAVARGISGLVKIVESPQSTLLQSMTPSSPIVMFGRAGDPAVQIPAVSYFNGVPVGLPFVVSTWISWMPRSLGFRYSQTTFLSRVTSKTLALSGFFWP